jgi:hypothetical protein
VLVAGACNHFLIAPASSRRYPASQPHDRHQEQSGDLGSWRVT